MNMRIRQPARRPLGPTKNCFNSNVGWKLGWKDSVDTTDKFSAAFTGFANVIFLSSIRIGPGIYEIEGSRPKILPRVLRFVFSPVPIQVVSGRQKTLQRILPPAVSR